MNRILSKKYISDDLVKFEISTTMPLKTINPGQYIILKLKSIEVGYPLPVIKTNVEKETITLIVLVTDVCNRPLADLDAGSTHFEIDGPFGYPAQIQNYGTVLCIGRCSGIIPLLPVLNALRQDGNQVISVLSAPSKEGIILHKEINATSDEVIIITDDGTYGGKRNISQVLGQTLRSNPINQVIVMGSSFIIKETCSLTTKYNIQTQAGMYMEKPMQNGVHGIFKVSICGNAKSVCVDGFNFNAWYANFDEMLNRFGEGNLEIQSKVKVLNQTTVPD